MSLSRKKCLDSIAALTLTLTLTFGIADIRNGGRSERRAGTMLTCAERSCHHGKATARVHPVHLMKRRLSAGRPPTRRLSQPTWTLIPPVKAVIIPIHHRHLLLLHSPKADTHFTVPRGQKVESTYRHCSKDVQLMLYT